MPQVNHYFNNTGGMRQDISGANLNSTHSPWIENLHQTQAGSWSNQNSGYVHTTTTPILANTTVLSLATHTLPSGVTYSLAHVGTNLYRLNLPGGNPVLIGTGLNSDKPVSTCSFLGWLFLAGETHTPYRWNGSDPLQALPGWPPTIAGTTVGNPSLVTSYANRLVFAGDANNPSTVYLSALENPTNFTPGVTATSAGAISISPGDGDKITALQSLYLPLTNEEVLLVFKQRSIYVLTGNDATDFQIQKLSGVVGAVSSQAVIQVGQDVLFLSEQGLNSLNTASLQGNLRVGSLSKAIEKQWARLNPLTKSRANLVYLEAQREVWCLVAEGSSSRNNRVFVLNLSQDVPVWSLRSGIEAASGLVYQGNLFTGGYDGKVYQQLQGHTYNGASFNWSYKTPLYSLENRSKRKRLISMDLHLSYLGKEGLTLKTFWDFSTNPSQVLSAKLEADGSNMALYGTSYYGEAFYSGSSVFFSFNSGKLHLQPVGSGKTVQFELSGNLPDQAITIEGWSIAYIEGGSK